MYVFRKINSIIKRIAILEDKRRVLVVYKIDNRTTSTHSGAKAIAMKVDLVSQIPFEEYDVIGIDEGQIFEDIDAIIPWLKTKVIIVAALNGNYKQEAFGNLYKIYPHVDHLILKNLLSNILTTQRYLQQKNRIQRE